MSWLARLKTGKTPEKDASKTTETLFVVSVVPTLACFPKSDGVTGAANDPASTPMTATADIGTVRPPGLSPLLLAASLALDASIVSAEPLAGNHADDHCWPHSTAMNGAEIDHFEARRSRFTDKGLTVADGEALADKLVQRDRASDDRRICLECRHLTGRGNGPRRCGNWQWARVAIRAKDAQLPSDFLHLPQRCDGFLDLLPTTRPAISDGRSSPFRDGAISSLKILGDKNDS